MYRRHFPEMGFLRRMIAEREESGQGWPTCILNVKAQQEYRPEVRGPLSLFMNLKGQSHCKVGQHEVTIDVDNYFLSNSGDHYDFLIDTATPTETFNIHIEQQLMDQVFTGWTTSETKLLDQPDHTAAGRLNFFTQLHRRNAFIDGLIAEIQAQQSLNGTDALLETEQMSRLLTHLMGVHTETLQEMGRIAAVRRGTREETYRRLTVARDYIHSCYDQDLSLDDLAATACMSRFHFLRAFKETFRCTPYQYLKKLRLDKAQWLLRESDQAVTDIGFQLGYQNLSSFSRVFRQMVGTGPQKFREQHAQSKFAILVNRAPDHPQ